MEYAGPANG